MSGGREGRKRGEEERGGREGRKRGEGGIPMDSLDLS